MATAPGVNAEYLDAAREAGLLHHLNGRPFVAGEYHDQPGNERQCVVEYCHPDLLVDGAGRLASVLTAQFPQTSVLVVRTPPDIAMPAPWLPHLTYVRFTGTEASAPSAGVAQITISAARPEHSEFIFQWLVQAFKEYGKQQEHRGATDEPMATATRLMNEPGRQSFVASIDGRVIGHTTLLCDADDDVAIGRHVELLDTLVDAEPPVHGAALSALTATAAAHADRLGLPLVGHVVHPTAADVRHNGEAIVRSLLQRGWAIDHKYWRCMDVVERRTECSST